MEKGSLSDTPDTILVIGLGNPILTDDSIGWRVAQAVREVLLHRSPTPLEVQVIEVSVGGLSLAELMIGFRQVIIVDAIMSGDLPGTVSCFKLSDLPQTLNISSAHDTNLTTALRTLRHYDVTLPNDDAVDIIAVEAHDVLTFGEQCTPAVEASIPVAVQGVMHLLDQF
jgi:hydrogenase maturation protease